MSRQANDSYLTPQPVAHAVTAAVHELMPYVSNIVEPSAGAGAFVKEARAFWPSSVITAVELEERHVGDLFKAGADDVVTSPFERWVESEEYAFYDTLILGNPPFSLAQEHISLMLDWSMPGTRIAMLLKMNFLCSRGRAENFWTRKQLRAIRPFDTRPSFVKGAKANNDTNEYALFLWQVGYTGEAEIKFPHITWGTKK